MRTQNPGLMAGLVLIAFALATSTGIAHHGASDPCQTTGIKTATRIGVITKVVWQNPHVNYQMEAADTGAGKASEIIILEWGSPRQLESLRPPITRDTVKIGDKVKVNGATNAKGDRILVCEIVTPAPESSGHK